MRSRLLLTLVVLALLGCGVVYCGDYPRHVDPAQLTLENPYPLQLFELYNQIYGLINVSDYAGARQLLASAEDITAPAGTLDALSRYNLLLGSVISELDKTEVDLAEAYEHLRWLREALAYASLTASYRELQAANGTAVELGSGSESLATILSYSPERLQEGLYGVDSLIDELKARILEGFDEAELLMAMRFEETSLEIAVTDARPTVGSSTYLTGSLVDSTGLGLGGKTVRLYLEGSYIGEADTDPGGAFKHILWVPYRYVESLSLRAEYWPIDEDRYVYMPSVSNTVVLSPVFTTPTITADVPGVVYPGMSFPLNGTVSPTSAQGTAMIVSYLGSIYSVACGSGVGFTVSLHTPDSAEEGATQIIVSSLAQGTVGPASTMVSVQVDRLPLEVAVEKPVFVFSGQSAMITGEVRSGGAPLQGCSVRVSVGGVVYSTSSDVDGEFALSPPFGVFALSRRQGFTLVADPREPWISGGKLSSEFLLINSLMAVAVPLLGLAAVYRRRTLQPSVGMVAQRYVPVEAPTVYPALPGLQGLYLRAVELVGRVTGERLRASDTIREYLKAVKPRLMGPVYLLFERISVLYERWFYGGRKFEPSESAETLVEKLRDKVEQGSA